MHPASRNRRVVVSDLFSLQSTSIHHFSASSRGAGTRQASVKEVMRIDG